MSEPQQSDIDDDELPLSNDRVSELDNNVPEEDDD